MQLAVVAAVVVFLLGFALIAWYGAEQLVQRRPPDPLASPADFGLVHQEVEFAARDGLKLRGYWIPAYTGQSAIVLCHGYNGSLDADLKYVPFLHRAGYHVLTFDFRGHGRSEGDWVSLGFWERSDLLGAVDWLLDQGIRRVGVWGFSMGAAVAISAATEQPAISVVVADGAFSRLQSIVEGRLRERYSPGPLTGPLAWAIIQAAGWRVAGDLPKAEPRRAVGRLAPCALLLIHGALDTYVPLDDIRELYRVARPPKSLWIIPEAGHREVDRFRPLEYTQRVLDFFKQYLP